MKGLRKEKEFQFTQASYDADESFYSKDRWACSLVCLYMSSNENICTSEDLATAEFSATKLRWPQHSHRVWPRRARR